MILLFGEAFISYDRYVLLQDTSTLGVVVVRHCGYTAIVKVAADVNWGTNLIPLDIEIDDQAEGGANALNVNRSVELARIRCQ